MERLGTVLQVAYPFARVGPDAVGGAEQVVYEIDRALVAAGHRSIVVAAEGSEVAGHLLPTRFPEGTLTDDVRDEVRREHRAAVAHAVDWFAPDLVHLHGVDFWSYLPPPGAPALVTLHLPRSFYPPEALRPTRPRTWLHCVSASQRRSMPADLPLLDVIENGVPVDALAVKCGKRPFALVLGRICPEKNQHGAMVAGDLAGVPVVLAGEVHPYEAHQRYFDQEIAPRLGVHRFVGPVGFARKRRLLGMARCVLLPSMAEETSSLVAMEALAAGTPVIGFAVGALPEIVQDGVTGFLVRDEAEMAEAMGQVNRIDPEMCRRVAWDRFPIERTTARYLARYAALATPLRARVAEEPAGLEPSADPTAASTPSGSGGEWRALWDRVPGATVFQSPEWLAPWAQVFADGPRITVEVRADERLVGLLPLYRSGAADGTLFPLGISTSDVLDGLFAPEVGGPAAEAALAALDPVPGWRVLDLQQLPPDSPLVTARPPAGSWEDQVEPGESCQVLALAESLEDSVPRRMFRNLRYYRERAEERGELAFVSADPDSAGELLDALVALHRRRQGGDGVLDDRAVAALREATPALLRAGRLRLYGLRIGRELAAALYGLADARRTCLYLSGFDPELGDLGVGKLLIGHAIERAIAEGHREVDFLRGGEDHKQLWGASPRPMVRRVLRR